MASGKDKYCTECGLQTLITENGQVVCAECGAITDTVQLVAGEAEHFNFVTTEQVMSRKGKYAKECESLHQGRMKTGELCDKLHLDCGMKEAATQKYVKLFKHDEFRTILKVYKMALVSACVYIEARQNNIPILMHDVTSILAFEEKKKFQKALHKAKSILGLEVQSLSYVDSVFALLRKTTFPSELFKQVVDMCKVLDQYWKKRSIGLTNTIYPSAYFVWLGSSKCPDKGLTYSQFCSNFKLSWSQAGDDCSKASKTFLIKLAKEIPWVCDIRKLNRKTVFYYLSDIIKYQTTLMNKSRVVSKTVPPSKSQKFEESPDEIEKKDQQIRNENPNLHDIELDEGEFEEEMYDFFKTPHEIDSLSKLKSFISDEDLTVCELKHKKPST